MALNGFHSHIPRKRDCDSTGIGGPPPQYTTSIMSLSPPIRRLSNPHIRQEELINAYEAEEERIINVLSRKLEQLREEKINLENALEAESESHVNKLSRELTALRLAQQQQQQQQPQQAQQGNGVSVSPDTRFGFRAFSTVNDPTAPSSETMFEAMRRENEQLRNRLADTERDYIRIKRLNEIYREELIEHRRRLGLSVDNLIGLSSDPFSQPTHHRSSPSSYSTASSPSTSVLFLPTQASRRTNGVPIPRPATQIHRHHSPSSSDSPFPFSPVTSTNPASYLSSNTNLTSPPTSISLHTDPVMNHGTPFRALSYPSVPPPSLSSSFGSPSVSYHMPHREHSRSPVEPLSRRNSSARRGSVDRRVAETGNLRNMSRSGNASRRGSVERGARIAETGILIARSRAGSQSLPLPSTMEVEDAAETSEVSTNEGENDV
ncbi:hypothetical protein AX17_004908 [Amanita inopinata Kibby_2008]|nr:hypothetical protein AX17_004908 [Amanita inopinata Kibby_2008]